MHGKFLMLISIAAGASMTWLISSICNGNFARQNDCWKIFSFVVCSHGFLALCAYAVRERQRRGIDDAKLWFVAVSICYLVGVFFSFF